MASSDKQWISLELTSGAFDTAFHRLAVHLAIAGDVIACDRTFASDAFIASLGLKADSENKYGAIFYASAYRYWGILTPELLRTVHGDGVCGWRINGLDNIALFRGHYCYLETIRHRYIIFVTTTETEVVALGIKGKCFKVDA